MTRVSAIVVCGFSDQSARLGGDLSIIGFEDKMAWSRPGLGTKGVGAAPWASEELVCRTGVSASS